jgi:GntR family transcriptional regulator
MTPRKRPSVVEEVRDSLLGDLTSGKLECGAKLANENELAERFGVSRSTIREAVGGPMDAGYLARRHGSGTYVTATPRTRHPLETSVSYTAMIRASGQKPAETVVSKAVREPDKGERVLLGLDDSEPVIDVERVRFAGKRPVIYSRDRIPVALLGEYSDEALDTRSSRAPGIRWPEPRPTCYRRSRTPSSRDCSRSDAALRCSTSIRSTTTSADGR